MHRKSLFLWMANSIRLSGKSWVSSNSQQCWEKEMKKSTMVSRYAKEYGLPSVWQVLLQLWEAAIQNRKEMDRVGATHTSALQGISQFLLSMCGIRGHKCTISGRRKEEKEVPEEFSSLGCVWIHGWATTTTQQELRCFPAREQKVLRHRALLLKRPREKNLL